MFSSLARAFLLLLPLASSVYGAAIPRNDNDHDHVSREALPNSWYHADDHPAHALFRRQATPSSSFPQVGSPTWASAYPASTPDSNAMPQAWKDALNNAVQAGKIPNIAPPVPTAPNTVPVYSPPVNPNDPSVCSASYGCRNPGDVYDAPQGVIGISFDDGPLPVSHSCPFMSHPNSDSPSFVCLYSHPITSTRSYNRTKSERLTFTSEPISSRTGKSSILLSKTRMILPCIPGHTLI